MHQFSFDNKRKKGTIHVNSSTKSVYLSDGSEAAYSVAYVSLQVIIFLTFACQRRVCRKIALFCLVCSKMVPC